MNIRRKRIKGTKDCRLTDKAGEDLGRVNEEGQIIYPEETALELIRGVSALESARQTLDKLRKELREYRAKPVDLKPLDFSALTRYPEDVFTHVAFEDYELSEALTEKNEKYPHGIRRNWLTLGQSKIMPSDGRRGDVLFGARMRDGITDFEHDPCYIVWMKLVGVEWKFTDYNVSYFEGHITPNHEDIKIWDPSFKPEEVEGAWQCDRCEKPHLMLPDGFYTPETSDLCRVVAGKRISIVTGPRWSKIQGDDDDGED